MSDVHVCFIGDSFVAGIGDPEHLGWAGRLAARTHCDRVGGTPLSSYNLGVRRQTSAEVAARLVAECRPRLPQGCAAGVVISCGVNDTTAEGSQTRVPVGGSVAALSTALSSCATNGWKVLVVGPPPVDDAAHNARTALVDARFATVCADRGITYVPVLDVLRRDPLWMRQVAEDDGAHPQAEGYALMADLVAPAWDAWVGALRSQGR
ncbi:GDSL-type esterase/lipase family protein [Quadrisphaera granulorum]|uniref:GDSL-type esterase/lipase family protein n=1 Tax=Quadrisphaera granulorum TaxID=317664 RepID=UPI000D6B16B6|nr:GDSL-type esterase/lipase family protein [Quadrisphaera granulorum]